ncbi:response regulator [Flammeovirga sp. SJP92]|uniref:response regulator n=1 Tax=Flammeovirga sp. SJP92 TaxID=1775430 RepID=UPI0007876436|nr:response regulator [Flammeovirga sp. SJP92]KXX72418.1 hypothetical protein AVL50_02110 [Flammeovirga sp. SJP92]
MKERRLKILLIENNPADIRLISYHINKASSKAVIRVTDDFDATKELINDFNPNIILCDYHLNGFTGLDVLEHLRNTNSFIRLIFVTGQINDEELAAQTILAGASGYILKKNMSSLFEKLQPYFNEVFKRMDLEETEDVELKSQLDDVMTKLGQLAHKSKLYQDEVLKKAGLNRDQLT